MKRKIIATADNSKTLLIPELNETYHSTKGALAEANHIFLKEGLIYSKKNALNIFEMGFGTGLNALLTLEHALENDITIHYDTIEKYPLSFQEAHALGYLQEDSLTKLENHYQKMFSLEDHSIQLHPNFEFNLFINDLKKINLKDNFYDIIYFDAFGPKVQSNLWTVDIMNKLHQSLKEDGFLVTYCAQGQFRRNLKAAGFEVHSLPGPPGKREMTRAFKKL